MPAVPARVDLVAPEDVIQSDSYRVGDRLFLKAGVTRGVEGRQS